MSETLSTGTNAQRLSVLEGENLPECSGDKVQRVPSHMSECGLFQGDIERLTTRILEYSSLII